MSEGMQRRCSGMQHRCSLTEFVQAFFLSMRYFFKPKATINYPFEKTRYRRASVASMYCAAIPTARSAASPAI
jgi:hypothetical protein